MVAIDLGSNTLRVLVYDCQAERTLFSYEKVVKTADGLAETGRVGDAAIQRVIDAICEAKEQYDFSAHMLRAVTTEAIRQASNAADVLATIEEQTGIGFEMISGDEEAGLTLLAVKHRLKKLSFASAYFVVADIGGGSTELIFYDGKERLSRSFPVGIVTIAQSYENLEQIETALPKVMLDMQMFCAEIYATRGRPDSFVATAGTPTTVAAMKLGFTYATYDGSKINGTMLLKEELDFYLEKLLKMPFEEREMAVGTGRSDLIAAGILIYRQLFHILEFERCIVIDDGLREGVALEMCREQTGEDSIKL